jgi:hypothetical protein
MLSAFGTVGQDEGSDIEQDEGSDIQQNRMRIVIYSRTG